MQNKPLSDESRPGQPSSALPPERIQVEPPPSLASRAVERTLGARRVAYAREVECLVAATFRLIERTGELEPRVSEIVSQAGLSNQAFYKHFRSKRELLVAVLDEGIQRLAGYLRHRMEEAASPSERVREWLRGMLSQALRPDAAAATRPFALSRNRLSGAYPGEVAASERRLSALVRDAIGEARAAGELPHADPERDAESLYHLAMGWMQARLLESEPPEQNDAERLVEFAMHGLARGTATSDRSPARRGS